MLFSSVLTFYMHEKEASTLSIPDTQNGVANSFPHLECTWYSFVDQHSSKIQVIWAPSCPLLARIQTLSFPMGFNHKSIKPSHIFSAPATAHWILTLHLGISFWRFCLYINLKILCWTFWRCGCLFYYRCWGLIHWLCTAGVYIFLYTHRNISLYIHCRYLYTPMETFQV